MREKAIRKLIEIVEESEIDILEVNTWWRRVKITRRQSQNGSAPATNNGQLSEQAYFASPQAPPLTQQPAPASAPSTAPEKESAPSNLIEIKSPMVGTFYTAPSPDAKAYVKVGDSVSVGTVVCIVEAMKLMNEIESEESGKIVKALVENAQPVEFGQPLFQIDPSA